MAIDDIAVYEALFKEGLRRTVSDEDPSEIHHWLSEQLTRIGGKTDVDAVLTWPDSFDYYESVLDKREANANLPEAERVILDWPWQSWNNVIDPLEPGILAVVSAPDGAGKTIVAESIAEHWARKRNRVAFIHYELNRALMMDRRASRHTSILRRDLASGRLTPEQRALIREMRPRLLAWDGYIGYVHTPGWDVDKTILKLKQMIAEKTVDVVVIDYLEKISSSRRQNHLFGTHTLKTEADTVETLKNFAEAAEIPILMLMQFSKAGKKKDTTDIDRTDIRDAGEKTERANIVVLLARKQTANGYSNVVDVNIDKNTLGATAKFQMVMQPEYFRLADKEDKLEEPRSRWKD